MLTADRVRVVPLDEETVADLRYMYSTDPVVTNARLSVRSRVLRHPMTYRIPKLNLNASPEMEDVTRRYFKPWHEDCFDWFNLIGVVPYYSIKQGPFPIPKCPEYTQGVLKRVVHRDPQKRHLREFRWYWYNQTGAPEQSHDPKMRFYVSHDAPTETGEIVTPLVSVLEMFRSARRVLHAQNRVVAQRSRPVHMLESRPDNARTATNDHLTGLSANFSARSAGLTRARREQARAQDERNRLAETQRSMRAQERRQHLRPASVTPLMRTDSEALVRSEIDNAFASQLYSLPENHVYREAGRPDLPVNYLEFRREFNALAAAAMHYPLELIVPSAGRRAGAANVEAAQHFEAERARELIAFFTEITRSFLVHAYRSQFSALMRGSGLHPELDVHVNFKVTSEVSEETLRRMHADGFISDEKLVSYLFEKYDLPLEDLRLGGAPVDRVRKRAKKSSAQEQDEEQEEEQDD